MSAFLKDMFREIRNTPGRFFSLIIITALGAASVVGIQATSIDMRAAADRTYKNHKLYDLQIKSSTGFNGDDAAALSETEGVFEVMPANVFDVYISVGDENRAIRALSLPSGINAIDIIEGRLPENAGECVVERRLMEEGGFRAGDSIRLGLDDMDGYFKVLTDETFVIVGVVSSPLYISFQRGNTMLGGGSLRYYMYLHPDAYKLGVFTDVYLLMEESRGMDNLTEDYYAAAEGWKRQAERTGAARVKAAKDELAEARRKIDEGWADYFGGLSELEEKTAEGRTELEDAKAKLAGAKLELEESRRELDESAAAGLEEIDRREAELISGRAELEARRAELEAGQALMDEARALLGESELLAGRQAELDEGKKAFEAARQGLDDGFRRINGAREALEEESGRARALIDEGWEEYYRGTDEYNAGVLALETGEADAKAKLAEARLELVEAEEKLDGAPEPEWFVFTRKEGVAFDSYYQDTLRLEKIGYVFPLVFFLVAVMVSLTSMSRMVENHRTQIGVYKALGYRPAAIMTKYLIYAFAASLIGGAAGTALGSRLFPAIIADAYGHLYNMPHIETPVPAFIAALAVISAVLSVTLVTLATCAGSMTGTPALLMRPKPPAKGKRVLLEKAPVIWNRLGFFSKVAARNVFRYKKRFIMTLAGVAGCSALLLTAFGLRNSVSGVADLQYGEIVKYDSRAYLKDMTDGGQFGELDELLPGRRLYIREEAVTVSGRDGGMAASLVTPRVPESLNDYINLRSPETGEPVTMDSGSVLITDKLARVIGVTAGGSLTITLSGGGTYSAVVTGIVDNYILHYVYMSPEIYAGLFGGEAYPNGVMFFDDGRAGAAPALLENGSVRAIVNNAELKSQIGDSTDAMGVVTVVLIALACALALVVLFNLTNINISERVRELATIKVLGFNDAELAMYIYRENAAVTLLGIGAGLAAGVFLHGYVISSVEIDALKFPVIIHPQSYAAAIVLSVVFAVFVNLVMSFKLARIDMVESLKNVE